MSTKIFDVYFTERDLTAIMNCFDKFKTGAYTQKMAELFWHERLHHPEKFMEREYDTANAVYDLNHKSPGIVGGYSWDINYMNNSLQVVVRPHKKLGGYVLFFTGEYYHNTMRKDFSNGKFGKEFRVLKLKDYHYQNQTDPYFAWSDNKYTDAQKKELEKDWKIREAFYKPVYYWSDSGFVYDFLTHDTIRQILSRSQELMRM